MFDFLKRKASVYVVYMFSSNNSIITGSTVFEKPQRLGKFMVSEKELEEMREDLFKRQCSKAPSANSIVITFFQEVKGEPVIKEKKEESSEESI